MANDTNTNHTERMMGTTNDRASLIKFINSRLPMAEYDLNPANAAINCIASSFFYPLINREYVNYEPFVSQGALEYAKEKYGKHAYKIFDTRRSGIVKLENAAGLLTEGISKSMLISEHVVTGGMFKDMLIEEFKRSAVGRANRVADWIIENIQTAWVLRTEDKKLTAKGFKSERGETLGDALGKYKECEIFLLNRHGNIVNK